MTVRSVDRVLLVVPASRRSEAVASVVGAMEKGSEKPHPGRITEQRPALHRRHYAGLPGSLRCE